MTEKEFIGMSVVEARIRREEYATKMRPVWRKVGAELRKIREGLKIARNEIANRIGVSESVLARLEAGEAIKRRRMVETSYRTMLHCIPLMRMEDAGLV